MSRVSRDDVSAIAAPEDAVVMRPLVRQAEHGSDLSVTWVRLEGRHRRLRTNRSTRVYYVLAGEATFVLGAEEPFAVRADDTVIVPRGVPYEFWGQMTYLVINGPAFSDGDDVYDAR
jgi:mannose-6-phosphate isomerase-like protein (cupin superfamily)